MDTILKKALSKAEGAEVFHGDYRKAEASYENGRLKTVNSVRMTGAGLRIIKDGRVGFASTTDFSEIDRLVGMAFDTAAAGPKAGFAFPGPAGRLEKVETVKQTARKLGVSEIVEMGARFVERLKKLAPDCYPETSITVEQERTSLENSSGLTYDSEGASYSVYFGANVVKGSDVLMVPAFKVPLDDEYDPDEAAEEIAEKLRMAEVVTEIEAGPSAVLFSPMGLDGMLISLGAGFNGKAVEMGVSPIKALAGKKALSEKLTVWNDPTVKYWHRSGPVDNEGVPTRKTALVDRGVVGSPMYDMLTAGMFGKTSTGSGYRGSFETPPAISPCLISVEPGRRSYKELLSSMEDGIYIDYCLGVGQGNYMAGEFSNNVGLGYKVKAGKIVGRVKNVMIAGNAYDVLKDGIVELGSERGFSMTMCLVPHMLVDKVSLSTKK